MELTKEDESFPAAIGIPSKLAALSVGSQGLEGLHDLRGRSSSLIYSRYLHGENIVIDCKLIFLCLRRSCSLAVCMPAVINNRASPYHKKPAWSVQKTVSFRQKANMTAFWLTVQRPVGIVAVKVMSPSFICCQVSSSQALLPETTMFGLKRFIGMNSGHLEFKSFNDACNNAWRLIERQARCWYAMQEWGFKITHHLMTSPIRSCIQCT